MSDPLRVRTSLTPKANPDLTHSLINYYVEKCKNSGRKWTVFSVNELPKSVNHMYKYMGRNRRLDKWVLEFRQSIKTVLTPTDQSAEPWKPSGVAAAIIVMRSPLWLTAKSTVRKMDADNKIKPIFDAIEKATGYPDENHWDFHVFKVPSKTQKLTVYLFDLGEVMEYYY